MDIFDRPAGTHEIAHCHDPNVSGHGHDRVWRANIRVSWLYLHNNCAYLLIVDSNYHIYYLVSQICAAIWSWHRICDESSFHYKQMSFSLLSQNCDGNDVACAKSPPENVWPRRSRLFCCAVPYAAGQSEMQWRGKNGVCWRWVPIYCSIRYR